MHQIKWFSIISFCQLIATTFPLNNLTSSFKCDQVNQHSGYIAIEKNKHLFYWYFESRYQSQNAPIILWINGGAGCSSLQGLHQGIGPCSINSFGKETFYNPHSWNKFTNLLFIDQPVGTGFSFGGPAVTNSSQATIDLMQFLRNFYNQFPFLRSKDLHLFSESYGGHFITDLALAILNFNKKSPFSTHKINLKSIGLGSPLLDPKIQFKAIKDLVCGPIPLLSQEACQSMQKKSIYAQQMLQYCHINQFTPSCTLAWDLLQKAYLIPIINSKLNIYHLHQPELPSNKNIENYYNLPQVQSQFDFQNFQYQLESDSVYKDFLVSGDMPQSQLEKLKLLIQYQLPILIYNGSDDILTNSLGLSQILYNVTISNPEPNISPIYKDNKLIARSKKVDSLKLVIVDNSGHYVQLQQPQNLSYLIKQWIQSLI